MRSLSDRYWGGLHVSADRIWVPSIEIEEFEIENLRRHAKDAIGRELNLSRHQRRRFAPRGDGAFSNILINNRGNFSDRIVPALVELPQKIKALCS